MEGDSRGSLGNRKLIWRYGLVLGVSLISTTLLYQNCQGGFHYDPEKGTVTMNESMGGNTSLGGSVRLTTFSPSGMVVPEGQSLEGGLEYRVEVSGSLESATIMWQLAENSGNCVLKTSIEQAKRFVLCDQAGRVGVRASVTFGNGSTSVLLSERTTGAVAPADACGTSTADRVVFRIPRGTGNGPWNSSTSPVEVYVGQTLRICNDDTVTHQLHTNGTPCAHQPRAMAQGEFYDCRIANLNGRNANTGIYNNTYDHNLGTNSAVYIRGMPGSPQ
ncbi:MAG: hypothetical protein RBT63_06045 [Bdellovibrionales bacterium]|nr:hypothetical protein [Bdellovibrionales bacterium]